jgi:hypothetical protein
MYGIKVMILTSSVCLDMHARRSASVQVLGALQKTETWLYSLLLIEETLKVPVISESFVDKSDPS